jgi:hypothetical protein
MSSGPSSTSSRSSSRFGSGRFLDYKFVSIDEECPPTLSDGVSSYGVSSDSDGTETPPCFSLLQQFYDELMTPTFPLEKERDDVDDWFTCFRMQMKQRGQLRELQLQKDIKRVLTEGFKEEGIAAVVQSYSNPANSVCGFDGPAMDVVLMILVDATHDDDDITYDDTIANSTGKFPTRRRNSRIRSVLNGRFPITEAYSVDSKCLIIGGAVVEYYKQSRVGLLSYIVLRDEFRGCKLARYLHEEALSSLENLANTYGASFQKERNGLPESIPLLQAVFAETNTAEASDLTPEQCLMRQKTLHTLGYRSVLFPYAQPPLTTDDVDGTFDNIILLTYFPFDENTLPTAGMSSDMDLMVRYCKWFLQERKEKRDQTIDAGTAVVHMNANIPFLYVEDFYQSVFGCNNNDENEVNHVDGGDGIPDYHIAKYYKLALRYTRHRLKNGNGGVSVCLDRPPWYDCKERLLKECQENS